MHAINVLKQLEISHGSQISSGLICLFFSMQKLIEYNHLEGDPGLDCGKDVQLLTDILNMVCSSVDNSSPDRYICWQIKTDVSLHL